MNPIDNPITTIIEIVNQNKLIQKYAKILGYKDDPTLLEDFAQDLYLNWIEKSPNSLIDAYFNNKLDDYVFKVVKQNVSSKTSPFYYKYIKKTKQNTPIEDYYEKL